MARKRSGQRTKQMAAYGSLEKVESWEEFCRQYERVLSRSKLLLAAAEDFMERANKYGLDVKTLRPLDSRDSWRPVSRPVGHHGGPERFEEDLVSSPISR